MDYTVGQVVFSKSGRDKGRAFIVFEEGDEYVYLVDGDLRKIEKPKKKRKKHVQKTNFVDAKINEKLVEKSYLLNSDIRTALKEYSRN